MTVKELKEQLEYVDDALDIKIHSTQSGTHLQAVLDSEDGDLHLYGCMAPYEMEKECLSSLYDICKKNTEAINKICKEHIKEVSLLEQLVNK